MACRAGCDSCCHVWLSVSPVEAAAMAEAVGRMSVETRAELKMRGERELSREARSLESRGSREEQDSPRCAMLDDAGHCVVYESRPLVCRTQGHALRYPEGFVPEASVRARARGGEITYCPLNYRGQPPTSPDVLDAERVDQLLAVVNLRFARAEGVDPEQRTGISEIAARADMLRSGQSEG
jgi:Fe-S-cluster containining protein